MIVGIGTDLTDARRIEALVIRFGQRFLHRIFTSSELSYALGRATPHLTLAKRFAAKEAVAKALGSGVRGFFFTDVEVGRDELGRPNISLKGGALKRLKSLLPTDSSYNIHLSLSDEDPYASAFVVIEASSP